MASPHPLLATPPARLDWSRPDTPAAIDFGDIYFSTDGGIEETRTVFLQGCGLPEDWVKGEDNHTPYTIAELGFGSGLNFLTTWKIWAEQPQSPRLHYVSIEKFPFDQAQLTRALSAYPELSPFADQLIRVWPGRVKGVHRLNFGNLSLTLIHEDVGAALSQLSGLKAKAWFLDGFSPSKNPDMWSKEICARIADLSAPDARLATFSVAGHVRAALTQAGFLVEKKQGYGRKRHRLEAQLQRLEAQLQNNSLQKTPHQAPTLALPTLTLPTLTLPKRSLIIGAGIAGRALAYALKRRGLPFDLIDSRAHPAASENPAALIKPRLDLQDRPESRFFLAAYLYALNLYEGAALSQGMSQYPKTEDQAARFQKLAQQNALGETHLRWEQDRLEFPTALVVDPSKIWPDFLPKIETPQEALLRAKDDGQPYSHIFIAAGYGIRQLLPELTLRFSRGQLSWAALDPKLGGKAVTYGGYAIPMDKALLVGATHDRLSHAGGDPFALRAEDDARNFAHYQEVFKRKLHPAPSQINSQINSRANSRASIRVTTANTLPRCLNCAEQNPLGIQASQRIPQWAITGLGSRGFVFAPLLAEALISHICGEVLPVEKAVWDQLRAPP